MRPGGTTFAARGLRVLGGNPASHPTIFQVEFGWMLRTDPHLPFFVVSVILALCAGVGSILTWYASRAKKVRAVEDQIMGIVRTHQLRVGQFETQLAEWKVVMEGILGEVQEFFERTTRERKRTQTQIRRAEELTATNSPPDIAVMPRDQQVAAVRSAFMGR